MNLPAFLVALFLLIVLLGYGLVAIPRHLWHRGNLKRQLDLLYFDFAVLDEELLEFRSQLRRKICKVKSLAAAGQAGRPIETLLNFCGVVEENSELKHERPVGLDGLVKLHVRLKKLTFEYLRSQRYLHL